MLLDVVRPQYAVAHHANRLEYTRGLGALCRCALPHAGELGGCARVVTYSNLFIELHLALCHEPALDPREIPDSSFMPTKEMFLDAVRPAVMAFALLPGLRVDVIAEAPRLAGVLLPSSGELLGRELLPGILMVERVEPSRLVLARSSGAALPCLARLPVLPPWLPVLVADGREVGKFRA